MPPDRKRRSTLFVALAMLAAVAPFAPVACSGPADLRSLDEPKPQAKHDAGHKDAGHKDAGDPDASDHAACNDYAAIICAKLDACTGGIDVAMNYPSTDECITREALACVASLQAPDNGGSPSGIERCGAAIAAGSCGDFFDHTNLPSPCVARPGPRPNDAPCAFNGQCASSWCWLAPNAACGLCSTRPDVGAPCLANADCGGQSLHCSSALGACEPIVSPGSACDAQHLCPYEESCVTPDGGATGTCTVRGAVGSACDGKLVGAPLCANDFGYFCPSATDVCALAVVAQPDESCGITAGVTVNGVKGPSSMAICYGGSGCFPTTAAKGLCTPAAADGARCDTALGPPCLNPARCLITGDGGTQGTCQILGVATDECSPAND